MRLLRPSGLALPLLLLLECLSISDSITITTVYAGKKKFRSYNLGISFLPTLVKVKPNRFALSFRQSRYIRPPKFKIEGSLPLKVPTIIMERPDPNAKPQIININKDIKLGEDEDYSPHGGEGGDYKAASEDRPTSAVIDDNTYPSDGQPVPMPDGVPPEEQWAQQPPPELDHSETQMMHFYPPPPHFLPPPDYQPMFAPEGSAPPHSSHFFPPPPFSPHHHHPPPFMSHAPPSLIDPMFMARSQKPQEKEHHRTRRSLNLREPYHHHIGDHEQQQQQIRYRRVPHEVSLYPHPLPSPPPYGYPRFSPYPPSPPLYNSHHPYDPRYYNPPTPLGASFLPSPPPPHPMMSMWPPPPPPMIPAPQSSWQSMNRYPRTISEKQDNIPPEAQQFVVNEVPVDATFSSGNAPFLQQQPMIEQSAESNNVQGNIMPLKINIGEHYDPNAAYIDESIIPSLEDAPLMEGAPLEQQLGEESSYQGQYQKMPGGYGGGGHKDTGPDDFRVDFSFSGVHGGPLVPLGTGDNIEQYYKALKKFKGNNLPVGLPPEQLYRYYRAHTFTDGIRIYRVRPSKVVKAKLIKALFG